MLRAVLDANVLASALVRPIGPPGRILRHLLERDAFQLVLSEEILEELRGCVRYPRLRKYIAASDEDMDLWIASLEIVADVVEPTIAVKAVRADPDDDRVLAAAIEGRAGHVVSGDGHLLDLGEYEGISIITPAAFLAILERVEREG